MSRVDHFSSDIPGPSTGQMPDPNRRSLKQPYEFTEEEMRVLKECNRDSFFQRCIPIGTGMGMAAWFGVKNGYLRPNIRYGATPKVVVSVIIGYFLGKLSYQRKCAEKFMMLPDSRLGQVLRQRKYGGSNLSIQESLDSLMPYSAPGDIYSDDNAKPDSGDSISIDTTRPEQRGLDDTHRPTVDNPVFEEEVPMPALQKKTTSYDELRKMNREQYQMGRTGSYNREQSTEVPPQRRMPSPSPEYGTPKITNKYGDAME